MYPTLAAALIRAKQASTVGDRVDDAYATELLEMSKGLIGTTTEYRPFWVAAKLLEQDRGTQRIEEAKNVKFNILQRTVDSLYATQRALDKQTGTIVPVGMEAIGANCDVCDTAAEVVGLVRRSPVSVPVRVTY